MKVPLILRLLMLLALAWALFKSNKKTVKFKPTIYEKLHGKISRKLNFKIQIDIKATEQIKRLFRDEVRNKTDLSTEQYLVFLCYELEKKLKKGSLFDFVWHSNSLIIALYQSFELLNLDIYRLNLKEILNSINLKESENLNQIFIKNDAFTIYGEQDKTTFEKFDQVFDIEIFANSVLNYVKITS